ncbi:agamous-like MADS-box protein AGL62-like [Trifolium medium]|uniref:Agamous-like MADS-box protein AGL62-like n=1 Tax=Trifolium medium TaxID=97028 RepID=A0A392QBJ4_9FABA|nr:agamous-like MADS-box protein AGL62-like [Trifolium medium]
MGRRKIEMEYLKDKDARYVAFSKRKNGLFKKASQLSTLCNARVGVFGFTPGGKPFAFGSPTFQAVTNEYLNEGQGESSNQNVENSENENLINLNEQLMDVTKELKEVEITKDKNGKVPNISYDDLDLEQLQKVKARLKELHGDIEAASSMLILAKEPR